MAEAPNRIRELRMAAGLSQQKLGDAIGTSKMTVSDLERGKMELTLDYMRRLSRALSCAPADLLPEEDNPWSLTAEEQTLITRLREASEEQRETLHRVTDAMLPFRGKKVA
ncbi:DNA-binding transcriptional regulator, XRE-family HTH domain [Sphingomonas jatrophae]|uniref:DNA-binding transcriptional regulator, XRE-family HTH domain n=2 Tax=Sphingomonas jatrophae TaxID=1166337 RepID=A0A1I6K6D4_9SPHN|nr:DNA-binding transcriptional regulator, XRE-family HTH domain [Sphingomonas jatrophae]